MNNDILLNSLRFVALLALQFFIMDQIHLFGFIDPMIYILFIILYPVENKRLLFLVLAFSMGLILDTLQDTGGAHAAASLTLAFTRPFWLKLVYGESYIMRNLSILQSPIDRIALILTLSIIIHHLVFYSLIVFNIVQILEILKFTFAVGIATFFVTFVCLIIFSKKSTS